MNFLPEKVRGALGLRPMSSGGGLEGVPHKVSDLERRFLVWTKKYKSVEEVPPFVSQTTMERARNRIRIKTANYMMLLTAIGCVTMVYFGKKAAKEGDSLTKQNLEWHRQQKGG